MSIFSNNNEPVVVPTEEPQEAETDHYSDVPSNPFEENKFDEYSNVSDEDYTKVDELDFWEDA